MASLPHDRESFLSTQLKSATVEDDAECGICQDVFKDPVELPCGHIFCRHCISLWLAGKKTCPLDRIPLFDAEDEVDDEIELPSMEEMFEMANDRIRALEANIVAVQEPFRAMRRMVEKSFHRFYMGTIKNAKTQAEVEEIWESRRLGRENFQSFRTNERTLWSAAASKVLEYAAQYSGREVNSFDPGRFPDVLVIVQAGNAQCKRATLEFTWMLDKVLQWGYVSVEDVIRGLDMADTFQVLRLDELGQHADEQHGIDQQEDDVD